MSITEEEEETPQKPKKPFNANVLAYFEKLKSEEDEKKESGPFEGFIEALGLHLFRRSK